MTLRRAFQTGVQAARDNILPGLLLQFVMACFLAAYLFHDGTRSFLRAVGDLRHEMGYSFALAGYIVSGALLPELLRIVFFQKCRPSLRNLWSFATAAPIFAVMGTAVDFFYTLQNGWFGTGNDLRTLVIKVLVDQFIYSPFFSNPIVTGYFAVRGAGFTRAALTSVFTVHFLADRVLPTQIAGWCVWIPAVSCVYFMPPALQLPVAILVNSFWVLILTTISERTGRIPHPDAK
jgi:hypothetical protein